MIICDICNKEFESKRSLANHKRWHDLPKYKDFQEKRRKKVSIFTKKRWLDPIIRKELCKKISIAKTGIKFSDEHRKKCVLSRKKSYEEGKFQIWNKGIPHTEEAKRKMSLAKQGCKMPPLSEGHKKQISIKNSGEGNGMWKGEDVGYVGVHRWVKLNKIKPKLCKSCKKVPPYDLANISGKHKRDIKDYLYLCRPCHHLFDIKHHRRDNFGRFVKNEK